jgi:dephospho-CoA kinase
MEKIIVGFAGKIASGKSSLAKWLSEKHGFEIISIAEPIYLISKALYGSDDRHLLLEISKKLKKYDKHFWLYFAIGKIAISRSKVIVIDDIRFPEEVLLLKQLFPTIVILLKVDAHTAWQRVQQRRADKDAYASFKEFRRIFESESAVDEIETRGLFDLAIDTTLVNLEKEKIIVERFLRAKGII